VILKKLSTGLLASNCYIIGENNKGVIIDPGAAKEDILQAVRESGLEIQHIILTHAHVDHMFSLDEIREELKAEVLVHKDDAEYFGNPWYNASSLFGLNKVFNPTDILLEDGQVLNVGGLNLEIIHTPGHTPGGICIKVGNLIFTGDTLFRMSVGRTDLGNGNYDQLMDSLKNKLMVLDENTIVYPGHGTQTTIGYEKDNNPFIF